MNKYMRCRGKGNSFSKKYCDLCEKDDLLMEIRDGITELFDRIPPYVVDCEMKLYRGISGSEELKGLDQIKDCGFVSTSTKRETAEEFADDDFVMTIIVPRGRYKMLFLNQQESEVLLPPGALFVKCPNAKDEFTYVYYPDGSTTRSVRRDCQPSPKATSASTARKARSHSAPKATATKRYPKHYSV